MIWKIGYELKSPRESAKLTPGLQPKSLPHLTRGAIWEFAFLANFQGRLMPPGREPHFENHWYNVYSQFGF